MVERGLFVALDVPTAKEALLLVSSIKNVIPPEGISLGYKVGMELFYREGLSFVRELQQQCDGPVFVDLKLHDIPNTVYRTSKNLASQGVRFFNVHASGGVEMMEAAATGAREGAVEAGTPWDVMSVIGVTVLTSTSPEQLNRDMNVTRPLNEHVLHLATLAKQSGLHGVVCSAQEATLLRETLGSDFLKVTPGIRLAADSGVDDQVRVMTPEKAVSAGATHLVVGRPITQASQSAQAAEQVMQAMVSALSPSGVS